MKKDFTMIYLNVRESFRCYDILKVSENESVAGQKSGRIHNVDITIRESSPAQGNGLLTIIDCQKINKVLDENDLEEMFELLKDVNAELAVILNSCEIPSNLQKSLQMYQGLILVENPQILIPEDLLPSSLNISEYAPLVIEIETNKFLKNLTTKGTLNAHNDLQRFLVNLSSKYNCYGEMEYHIVSPLRSGRLDLVWKKNKRVFLAIEIDFSNREKSILKLLGTDAVYRIWIYFGNENPVGNLKRLDPQGKIHFIEPPFTKQSFTSKR